MKDFQNELTHCCREFIKLQVWDPLRKFQWWNSGKNIIEPSTHSDTPYLSDTCTCSYVQAHSLRLFLLFSILDVKRASAGAKLLMRFGASIIDKYNALSEEERDTNSILGHVVRMQVPNERARLADVVGMS